MEADVTVFPVPGGPYRKQTECDEGKINFDQVLSNCHLDQAQRLLQDALDSVHLRTV